MSERLAKVIVRGRNKDGVPSYAVPLTKQDMEALNLQGGEKEVWIRDDIRHGLSIRSKYWDEYCKTHSALSEMFDQFWKEHPEITDHQAYLDNFWKEQAKENQSDNKETDFGKSQGKEKL